MRKPSLFVLILSLFVTVASALAKQQDHYVFNGNTLRTTDDNSVAASHTRWQVWLYQEGVHILRHTAGLQYSRWGLIEQNSPESVMKRLKGCQSFKKAYLSSLGPVRGGGIPSSIQSALSE